MEFVNYLVLWTGIFLQSYSGAVFHLRQRLLENYTKDSPPVLDHTSTVTVKFGLSVLNINLNDEKQTMEMVSILHVTWKDEFLTWNEENIDRLHFDPNEIWKPDIALFNSMEGSNAPPKSLLPLPVLRSGTVLWLPPYTAEVFCNLDLFTWPKDIHTCTFRFGSWAHHGGQLDLQLSDWVSKSMSFSKFTQNNNWQLINYTSSREETAFDDEVYVHINFNITVQRNAEAHETYVTHAAMTVMVSVLSSYFLPLRQYMSRMFIHLFSLVILIMCNIALFLSIPATGGPVPHVVKYFSGTIVLTTMSLISNIIMIATLNLSKEDKRNAEYNTNVTVAHSTTASNSEWIRYETLNEELSEFRYNVGEERQNSIPESPAVTRVRRSSSDANVAPSDTTTSNSETEPKGVAALVSRRNLHRTINTVFLIMYSIAYIIDYIVMKSSISEE